MGLTCDIVVQNWSCSSQGVGGLRKPCRASVSVGRKPCSTMNKNRDETAFLLVCTAKNMSGVKYKIIGNISNVFARFLENGKATIRFKEPPHDLCISKADPTNLRKLLGTLKLTGKDLKSLKLPRLTASKTSDIQNVKSLTVDKRSDYPMTSTFPATLTKLVIMNCGMVRIDVRILSLQFLVSLDLSNNKIKKPDIAFERLKSLQILNMSSNNIQSLPSKFCRSILLKSLDLSNNQLTCLPLALGRMHSLVTLKLDNNKLCSLPCNIGGLTKLRHLSVSGNQLRTIPHSLQQFNLDNCDVSSNPFMESATWYDIVNLGLPSLQECAGRTVRKSRISYDHQLIGPYLCDYLDSGKRCYRCGGYAFDSIAYKLVPMNIRTIAHTVLLNGMLSLPCEVYYCSNLCMRHEKMPD